MKYRMLIIASLLLLSQISYAQNINSEWVFLVAENILYRLDISTGTLSQVFDAHTLDGNFAYIEPRNTQLAYLIAQNKLWEIRFTANGEQVESTRIVFEDTQLFNYAIHPNPNLLVIGHVISGANLHARKYQYCLLNIGTGICNNVSDTASQSLFIGLTYSDIFWKSDTEFIPLSGSLRLININADSVEILNPELGSVNGVYVETSNELLLLGNRYNTEGERFDATQHFYLYNLEVGELSQLSYPVASSNPSEIGLSSNNETVLFNRASLGYLLLDFATGRVICELPEIADITWLQNREAFLGINYTRLNEDSPLEANIYKFDAISCEMTLILSLSNYVSLVDIN